MYTDATEPVRLWLLIKIGILIEKLSWPSRRNVDEIEEEIVHLAHSMRAYGDINQSFMHYCREFNGLFERIEERRQAEPDIYKKGLTDESFTEIARMTKTLRDELSRDAQDREVVVLEKAE